MRALRAALSQREPAYHGRTTTSTASSSTRTRVQAHVPMWVGGRTCRSLRRAVELGDGWAPFGLRTAELGEMLARARDTDVWAERSDALRGRRCRTSTRSIRSPSPSASPSSSRRFAEIGATGVNVRFVHHSPRHYCEQLAALAELDWS